MRTSDVAATILLIVLAFITVVLAISFERARAELWTGLQNAAIDLEVYGQVNSFYLQLEVIFWMVFLLSLIGIIIVYFVGSHEEEGETYAPPQEYMHP